MVCLVKKKSKLNLGSYNWVRFIFKCVLYSKASYSENTVITWVVQNIKNSDISVSACIQDENFHTLVYRWEDNLQIIKNLHSLSYILKDDPEHARYNIYRSNANLAEEQFQTKRRRLVGSSWRQIKCKEIYLIISTW